MSASAIRGRACNALLTLAVKRPMAFWTLLPSVKKPTASLALCFAASKMGFSPF